MDGYLVLAESYRTLVKQGKIDHETADNISGYTSFLLLATRTIFVFWQIVPHLMISFVDMSVWHWRRLK